MTIPLDSFQEDFSLRQTYWHKPGRIIRSNHLCLPVIAICGCRACLGCWHQLPKRRHDECSHNLSRSLIYNRSLTEDIWAEENHRLSTTFQENTSGKSNRWSIFWWLWTGERGAKLMRRTGGTVAPTLALHLWCNIYCSRGRCHTRMPGWSWLWRQLGMSIIHDSVCLRRSLAARILKKMSLKSYQRRMKNTTTGQYYHFESCCFSMQLANWCSESVWCHSFKMEL